MEWIREPALWRFTSHSSRWSCDEWGTEEVWAGRRGFGGRLVDWGRMKCPYCGFAEDRVVDSRESKEADSIRRRRECASCEKRFYDV